ncbi:endonuclease [Cellulophaga baltica]|nr:endonuclease [Cellulophaga baltica]
MKKISILTLFSVVFFGCSSDSGTTEPIEPTPTPDPIAKSVAVNDAIQAIEDQETIISGLLSNDTVENNARITRFDGNSNNGGTIVDNRNNTYTYEPAKSYVGVDTFTYTICDSETVPNCSTATVAITVEDEGMPIAMDDIFYTVKNTAITINNALVNDSVLDDASLASIDSASSFGVIAINSNGSIQYTPAADFTGDDTFTYTICDDDTPNPTCATATITVSVLNAINFNIPAGLDYYYGDLILANNVDVSYNQLKNHTVKNHTTILSYGQRHTYLYNADADLSNSDNVILMYSSESRYWQEYTSGTNAYQPQTFNTEHIYPQSKLNSDLAVSDLHHLRSADANINSERLNYPYTSGSGTYQLINNNSWYPGDEWKGDVARMIFYLNVRYGETFEKVGTLELFLQWNVEDPVSPFEEQRNNVIESAQGDRNPFIDNPYLATLIWGGTPAENKWQ